MAKTYIDTVKYLIKADIEVDGIVERPDVVGAIFGQTEGLLGDELDLRELQKSGRIGRIEVEIENKMGKSIGKIKIPSSLDADKTSAIAAALEQIERVGPSESHIKVKEIKDTRENKREKVLERAQELRSKMMGKSRPESKEISKQIREGVRSNEIQKYGEENLAAGPKIDEAKEIIVTEGRADVLNLLRANIKNVICLHGKNIPETVKKLSKEKKTTLFVDGDRGGELVAKQFDTEAEPDYIAQAPEGKEVEELTQKEILQSLRKKRKKDQWIKERDNSNYKEKDSKKNKRKGKSFGEVMEKLKGTMKGALLDNNDQIIAKIDVKDLKDEIKKHEDIKAAVFDGIITQQLINTANKNNVKYLAGRKKGKIKKERGINLLTYPD